MARSSRPSLPPTSDQSLRRLSRARSAERPLRAQAVIAAALGLILLAVPAYLLRRPSSSNALDSADAGLQPFGPVMRERADAGRPATSVVLGAIQRVRCGASATQSVLEGEACDPLPALEAALRQSVAGSAECAPRTGKEGSLNFVLEVDFSSQHYNIFPGRSGKWRGPQARRTTQCVLRAFPPIDLGSIRHQFAYYAIAVLAVYPAPDPLDVTPNFE